MNRPTRPDFRHLAAATLVCFLAAPSLVSAQWNLELGGEVSVITTDNLRLLDSPLEESDTVFLIRPTIGLTTDGDRIDADIRYSPEAYYYADASESNEVFNVLDGRITTTLVRDAFFFDLRGTNFQTMVSPDVAFQLENLPVTGNRVDSTVLEARPYWQQDLGFANASAELSYVESRFDDASATPNDFNQNNVLQSGALELNNYSEQEGIAWGFSYSYLGVDYDLAVPYDYQIAMLNLGYWVNASTRVFVEGGLESAFDNPLDPTLEDDLWQAGFQYSPNDRLSVEIAAGERTFGSTMRADVSYELRRGNLRLTYSESPATRAEIGLDRQPIAQTDVLDSVLDRPGAADRFVQRTGELATQIELPKSELSLRVFFEERDQRTNEIGTLLGDERFAGAALRWSWRLGSKSTIGFNGDFARREEFRQAAAAESDQIGRASCRERV